MTVQEALQLAARYLTQHRLPSPREDAELLIASVIERDRAFLYSHGEALLSEGQECLLHEWLAKRADHYPLQYLRGKQEFYGREFMVRPGVFIPRPETELLVESGLESLADRSGQQLFAADVGTGSGCIAVSLACEEPRVVVTATDISPEALRVARLNAGEHGCRDRIELHEGSILQPVGERLSHYHLVVCNPPYVGRHSPQPVDPSVEKHEPPEAVFAGEAGDEVYLSLFQEAKRLLSTEGNLVVELGYDASGSVAEMAQGIGWVLRDLKKDLSGIDRCAVFELPPPAA